MFLVFPNVCEHTHTDTEYDYRTLPLTLCGEAVRAQIQSCNGWLISSVLHVPIIKKGFGFQGMDYEMFNVGPATKQDIKEITRLIQEAKDQKNEIFPRRIREDGKYNYLIIRHYRKMKSLLLIEFSFSRSVKRWIW